MSNTVNWRRKPRTGVPNSRQKRNGLFLDVHLVCEGCRTSLAVHAHHMLDRTFPCRTSWHAMRAFCERCHITWHQPLTVSFRINGVVVGRAQLSAHDRIQFTLSPAPVA